MKAKLPHRLRKNHFYGLAILGFMVLAFQLGFSYIKKVADAPVSPLNFVSEASSSSAPLILTEFNPNDLDEKQWMNLGFSEKQTATILKYKGIVGGSFKSKEQLAKCYSISKEKFAELEPYILLPETNYQAKSGNYDFKKFTKKELKIPGRFNPDQFSVADFVNMGFSENQANAILKYKNYLGGSFVSKEKFKECFIISDENYKKLAPYLLLPEKTPENFRSFAKYEKAEKPKVVYHNFDPNTTDFDGWKAMGFSDKQAQVIVNYRDKNLRGSFKSLEDIQKCFVISEEKFQEMKPYIQLNQQNFAKTAAVSTVQKTETAVQPDVKTDFSKVDLNQITFKQLREFGFDERGAAGILAFRKKLGGFVNREQLYETYEIDRELAQKLIYTVQINNSSIPMYRLSDAPEDWLRNHPYFKFSADKIIFYRISNPDDKKIWKFLKTKPEYEAKMRLYLK